MLATDSEVLLWKVVAALEGNDAVVEVHGKGGSREVCRGLLFPAPISVQFVDEPFAEFDERAFAAQTTAVLVPIGRMQVFDHVYAIVGSAGIEKAEGFYDVGHAMAAIVENDVRSAKFVQDGLQECGIGLAADANLDLVFFKLLALWIDIQTYYLGVGTKIALPHLGRAAASATDLQEEHWAIDVAAKMLFVGGEIMLPLVDCPVLVVEKFGPESQVILAFSARLVSDRSGSIPTSRTSRTIWTSRVWRSGGTTTVRSAPGPGFAMRQ